MGDDDTVLDGNSSSDRTASQSPLAKACGALDMQCKTSKSMLERTCIILCVFAALLFVNRLYQMRRIRGWFGLEEGMVSVSMVRLQAESCDNQLIRHLDLHLGGNGDGT